MARWMMGTRWEDDDEAGVEFHATEEPDKVDAVVRDESDFILDNSVGQCPVRLVAQTEMVDVRRFEPAP